MYRERLLHFDRVTKHHIRVSNIILTTNLLTLMVRHIRFFFDILGRVRSLTLTAEVCTYSYAFEQCRASSQSLFALSSFENISDVHKSLFSGARQRIFLIVHRITYHLFDIGQPFEIE